MFNIDKLQDTYTWKIEVKIPQNNGFQKMPITVKYKRLPHNEKMALIEQMNNLGQAELSQLQTIENDLFDRMFAGWEKGQIKDENGDLDDTAENRQKLLNITEFRQALMYGFTQSMGGDAGKLTA